MDNVRIGSCSWAYDSWRGIVYPETGKINYLKIYAETYNTVEIDRWFWSLFKGGTVRLPDPKTVQEYLSSVPQDFQFTVKVPNAITLTHYYNRNRSEPILENPHFMSVTVWERFLKSLEPIKNHIGALMFQFEYMNKRKMNSQNRFLSHLDEFFNHAPAPCPIAVEVRNPRYLNVGYFEFLNLHNLHHVWIQGYYMPPVFDSYRDFLPYTGQMSVIRLMGPNRKDIEEKSGEKWNRIWDDRDEELDRLVLMVEDFVSQGTSVYINVNNHYEGSAPLTIERIKKRLTMKA
jgi:uncharacterized protein YecE (DUF72 family)